MLHPRESDAMLDFIKRFLYGYPAVRRNVDGPLGWYYWGQGDWNGPCTFEEAMKTTPNWPSRGLLVDELDDTELGRVRADPRICMIAIMSTKLTSDSAGILCTLPNLDELILLGQEVTDEFLMQLRFVSKKMETITLTETSCTDEGVRSFLKLRNSCRLYRGNISHISPVYNCAKLVPFLPEDNG